jgi:hypothetical protein
MAVASTTASTLPTMTTTKDERVGFGDSGSTQVR